MYIALYQHWDYALYGASVDGAFLGEVTVDDNGLVFSGEGFATGLVGGDQLCFPIGNHLLEAELAEDEDSDSDSDSD